MGAMKNQATASRSSIYTVGPTNPHVDQVVRCTVLKPWGRLTAGEEITGLLERTLCVGGRVLIGEVLTLTEQDTEQRVSLPWSCNFIQAEVVG